MSKAEQLSSLGYEKLSVAAAAVGFSDADAGGVTYALIRNEGGGEVRWRDDGTNPTASEGILLRVDEILEYRGQLSKLKFIRAASTSASLYAALYK